MTSPIPSPTGDPTTNSNNKGYEEEECETEVERDARENNQAEERLGVEGEEMEEGENVEVKGEETEELEKAKGIAEVEEDASSDDERTLNERAVRRNERAARRNWRSARRLKTEGMGDTLEEAASIVNEEMQAAKRTRKGKQIAVPNMKRKPRWASLGVVIQEPIGDPIQIPYNQSDEEDEEQEEEAMETSESEGVYEKLEVKVDKKLLEAMVYFKDPKKREEAASSILEGVGVRG